MALFRRSLGLLRHGSASMTQIVGGCELWRNAEYANWQRAHNSTLGPFGRTSLGDPEYYTSPSSEPAPGSQAAFTDLFVKQVRGHGISHTFSSLSL